MRGGKVGFTSLFKRRPEQHEPLRPTEEDMLRKELERLEALLTCVRDWNTAPPFRPHVSSNRGGL